jgi:hypothetical protein
MMVFLFPSLHTNEQFGLHRVLIKKIN